MATNKTTMTPQQALLAALADLAWDARGAFILSAPAPMTPADADKILDIKGVEWDKTNRHVKAEARRVWIAGAEVVRDFDQKATAHFKANPLTKGNWKQMSNRAIDAVIDGAASPEAAWTKAEALTKSTTEDEKAQAAFNRGHQLMVDAISGMSRLTKARRSALIALLEDAGKDVI